MRLITKFLLVLTLLSSSLQGSKAKIYFADSAEKIKKKGYAFTIKQMDSSDEFNVLKTQKVGIAHWMRQFFSPSGKYLIVYLTRKKKQTDELVVYSTSDFSEVFRENVKVPSFYYGAHIEPFFNEDETIIALQVMESKKMHMINAYNIEDGRLLYSKPIDKKSLLIGQSATKNTLYVGGKPGIRGYSSIEVIDFNSGKSLNKFAKKKAKYHYKPIIKSNLFIADYLSSKRHDYEMIILDDDNGKSIFREKIGDVAAVFTTANDGNDVFFVKKSRTGKGFSINQLIDNNILELISTEIDIKPIFITVNSGLNRFLVASGSNFVLFDNDKQANSDKIAAPFDIATGYFSSDSSLVYLREGTGSEVGVIDFEQQRVVKDSGTGRKSVKFGQFMASVALGAASGYYTGYVSVSYQFSDTAMLLSRDEQRLYVVNAKTNDVTLFNAKDLSGRKGIATGKGTFGVFQLSSEYFPEEKDSNVFVVSPGSISYFNQTSLEAVKVIKYKTFINFDAEENLLFTKDKQNNVNIYQLSTGEKLTSIEQAENLIRFNYYSPIN